MKTYNALPLAADETPTEKKARELKERKTRIRASRQQRARAYLAREINGSRTASRIVTGIFIALLALAMSGAGVALYFMMAR